MFLPCGLGCLPELCWVGMNCMAQACCWYHVFRCCGCVPQKHQKLQEQKPRQPPPQPPIPKAIPVALPARPTIPKEPNPFLTTGVPKDSHLEPVYKL